MAIGRQSKPRASGAAAGRLVAAFPPGHCGHAASLAPGQAGHRRHRVVACWVPETMLVWGRRYQCGGQMNQQPPDLPRSVQIIGRYRSLIGVVALLGALVGVLLAALNPPASSSQTLVVFTAPTCPAGGICGGPAFSPAFIE